MFFYFGLYEVQILENCFCQQVSKCVHNDIILYKFLLQVVHWTMESCLTPLLL
jgi:hypothetical protein